MSNANAYFIVSQKLKKNMLAIIFYILDLYFLFFLNLGG